MLLNENDKLKKEIIDFKVHDNFAKKKKSLNDQSTMAIIRNQMELEKQREKNCELEA